MSAPETDFERWDLQQRRDAAIEHSTDLQERWATTDDPEMDDPAAEQARLRDEIAYLSNVDAVLGALAQARQAGDAAVIDALERQRAVYDQQYADQVHGHEQAAAAAARAEQHAQVFDAADRDRDLLALARRQEAGYLDPSEFYSGTLSADEIDARLTETVRSAPEAFRGTDFDDRLHPDQRAPAALPPDPEHEQIGWDQLGAVTPPTRSELRGALDGPEPWDEPVGVPDPEHETEHETEQGRPSAIGDRDAAPEPDEEPEHDDEEPEP